MGPARRRAFRVAFVTDATGEVTAILQDCPANPGRVVCYAHIGQHGEASREWVSEQRTATIAERADLLAEVACIYKSENICITDWE
jgi:hypothetical protein